MTLIKKRLKTPQVFSPKYLKRKKLANINYKKEEKVKEVDVLLLHLVNLERTNEYFLEKLPNDKLFKL